MTPNVKKEDDEAITDEVWFRHSRACPVGKGLALARTSLSQGIEKRLASLEKP